MKEQRLLKGSLWVISGQFVSMGFQAAYFVLMGRTLGSREYGAFVGVATLILALTQFSAAGMEMILLRNISRDRKTFAATWGNALLITVAGFVLLLAVASLFARLALPRELRLLIPWIAVGEAVFGKVVQLAGRAFQGAGDMPSFAKLTTLVYVVRAALAGVLYAYVRYWGGHADAYTWARIYWVAGFAVSVYAFWRVTATLGWPRFGRIRLRDLSEGFSFSLSNSSISAYNDIDKTFLVSLGQTYAAGIYSAAYRVVDVATAPLYGIYTAATPRMFREGAKSVTDAATQSRRLLLWTIPYGLAIAALLYLAAPLVPLAFGPSFQGSIAALRWLCLLPLLRVFHYAWGTTITASASQWNRTATQVGAVGLNVLLNFLLIPRWSWQGAAVASLLTDGSLAISSRLVLWRIQRQQRRVLDGQESSLVTAE
jgi:O-antigen/teichoic acid export membrane protein